MNDNDKISVVMITADRNKKGKTNYLTETLVNLKRSNFWFSDAVNSFDLCATAGSPLDWTDDSLLFDSSFKLIPPNVKCHAVDSLLNDYLPCENAGRALVIGSNRNSKWVLFLEDDLDFCADFIQSVSRWLEKFESDDHRLYVFGTPYDNVLSEFEANQQSLLYPIKNFYGTQCFAIRSEDACSLGEYLLSNPLVGGIHSPGAYDLMIHDWMEINYPTHEHFLSSVPSFVQHIGRQSIATGLSITHTFESFQGNDWSFRSKRVLWVGDSPNVSTGFSLITRKICNHLHLSGWDVHVLGLAEKGNPHTYPYKIYPCLYDSFGVIRLPELINEINPDLVVLLNDPWNVADYFTSIHEWEERNKVKLNAKVIAYLAVDGKNQQGHLINELHHVITWTEFAKQELLSGGCVKDISVVPLAVDSKIFYPMINSKKEIRALVMPEDLPDDAFIVGVLGRNQYRKRLDLVLQYFAEWVKNYAVDNAWLYLYYAPTGEQAFNLPSLVKYYGLGGKVIAGNPPIGKGQSESYLRHVYNSLDVFMSLSQGEGWCLPVLEAMACGVPCVVAEWAAFSDLGWIGNEAVKIPCSSTNMTAPMNDALHTIGGIASKPETIGALANLYMFKETRQLYRERGLKLANNLTWESTNEQFITILNKIIE